MSHAFIIQLYAPSVYNTTPCALPSNYFRSNTTAIPFLYCFRWSQFNVCPHLSQIMLKYHVIEPTNTAYTVCWTSYRSLEHLYPAIPWRDVKFVTPKNTKNDEDRKSPIL